MSVRTGFLWLSIVFLCSASMCSDLHAVTGVIEDRWSSHRGDNGNTACAKTGGAKGEVKWKAWISKGKPSEVVVSKECLVLLSIHKGSYEQDQVTWLYAVDSSNGRVKWKKVISTAKTIWLTPTPAVDDLGNVYVATYDGQLLAFRCVDGEPLWNFEAELTPTHLYQFAASSPKVGGSMVYVAFGDYLYAVDRTTGKQQWRKKAYIAAFSSPAFDGGGHIYVFSERLLALDATSGNESWSAAITQGRTPVYKDERIYLVGWDGKIYCVDSSSGRTIWHSRRVGNAVLGSAVCTDNIVYALDHFGNTGHITAIDGRDGKVKWEYSPVTGSQDPCVDANGTVYTTLIPKLIAIDSQTRKLKWALDLHLGQDFSYSSPSIGPDGTIYIANGEMGVLYAVQ